MMMKRMKKAAIAMVVAIVVVALGFVVAAGVELYQFAQAGGTFWYH
jgi:hypothetical protein